MSRRLAAIMFTDLEGYSRLAHGDERGALRLLEDQERLMRPLVAAHHGRKIKSMGDGLLVEFPNARDAVECAVVIQRAASEREGRVGAGSLRIRIGIHLGDVERRGTDILGDAVNIASRIEPLADAGGVCISGPVHEQVRHQVPYPAESLGPRSLKGVAEPVEVYRVVLPWTHAGGPTREAGPTRLAVLPFANISPDPKDEYIADGLTEELITVLSQLTGLQVIARTSILPYKTAPKPLAQIGAELGVGSILEGSVRKSGEQLRITAQLIEVRSLGHVWASTYDRKLDDIFAVQSDVAKRIAEALRVKVAKGEQERLDARSTSHPESYLAYLRGRALLSSVWSEPTFRAAKAQFELAVSLDPTNARAYTGLADATTYLGWGGYEGTRATWDRVRREYAARAIELDSDLAEAHCSLAMILWDDWEFDATERELKRALALNPSYAQAHHTYSNVLRDEGRVEEALRESELAVELDPQSVTLLLDRVAFLCQIRRTDAAKPLLERLNRMEPDSARYHTGLAWLYYAEGQWDRSIEECDRSAVLDPEPWAARIPQAWLHGLRGEPKEARRILQRAKGLPERAAPSWMFVVGYALADDFDEAFRILFKSADEHNLALQMIRNDPALEPLRRDPRFLLVLKKMNLA